jgi:hypothetical protein
MNKVEVVNGWFYVDGKFILNFDFTDRYTYNITNMLIGEDTKYILSKHNVSERVKKLESILPLEAVHLTNDGTLVDITIVSVEHPDNNTIKFNIINNTDNTQWTTRDLASFFDPKKLLEMQTYRVMTILNNLYKENYDLNVEKNYTLKLFGDFKDRGFGESNGK